jgi:hypothetical protein
VLAIASIPAALRIAAAGYAASWRWVAPVTGTSKGIGLEIVRKPFVISGHNHPWRATKVS